MRRIELYISEKDLQYLEQICREEGYETLDECVAWAVQSLLDLYSRCHTGSISSSVRSDNPNHPPML
ncbi:MAG: hypothetical protein GXO10_04865 [Crenarchaeota archaeon]|nr:hypothetical protein [Thermoproteota archaeon]